MGVIASDRGIPSRSSQLILAFHKNGTNVSIEIIFCENVMTKMILFQPLKMPDIRVIGNTNDNAPILLDEEESFEVDEDIEIGEVH